MKSTSPKMWQTSFLELLQTQNQKRKSGGHGILYPPTKKRGGHVPRVPHQIAPMNLSTTYRKTHYINFNPACQLRSYKYPQLNVGWVCWLNAGVDQPMSQPYRLQSHGAYSKVFPTNSRKYRKASSCSFPPSEVLFLFPITSIAEDCPYAWQSLTQSWPHLPSQMHSRGKAGFQLWITDGGGCS